jgi:histidinol-phosphate aminotransferase
LRPLPADFTPYAWAMSTAEAARIAGISPAKVLRFDGNTSPRAPATARPETIAAALAEINRYAHGGFPTLIEAIAEYAGVEPVQVVLGAGADNLILLCARSFAGPGDRVAVADQPTYPVLRIAAWLAGAEVGDEDPLLTFCCRPHNPTGALVDLPAARPLAVDEAYFEYARAGVSGSEPLTPSAAGLLGDGVVVIRTFSKAFGLAAARIGYALADKATATELRQRQDPLNVTSLSAALAVAGLADPPDVTPTIEERERLAAGLRELGYEPLPSYANFLFVPVPEPQALYERLLRLGLVVRPFDDAIRVTVREPDEDEQLLAALGPRRVRNAARERQP